jgi:hypothetical protein
LFWRKVAVEDKNYFKKKYITVNIQKRQRELLENKKID